MNLILPKRTLSRRRLLQGSGISGVGFLLGGCGTNLFSDNLRQISEPLVESMGSIISRTSQLDPCVQLSLHTAPDVLSLRFCSCVCNRG
ncbi:hypothetical protein LC607_33435, partial [Nostoc sp. CHAB 5824]|nr:hypothetical protein [Nostoc sp. CHAB 5824]